MACRPVEVWQANDLLERRESAIGKRAKDILNPIDVSFDFLFRVMCNAYPVSGSFRNGRAASATEANASTEQRIVNE